MTTTRMTAPRTFALGMVAAASLFGTMAMADTPEVQEATPIAPTIDEMIADSPDIDTLTDTPAPDPIITPAPTETAPLPAPIDACDTFECNSAADPNRHAPGYIQAEDGSWVPDSFYNNPATTPQPEDPDYPAAPNGEPMEDDPDFDCRIHGNHICGAEVEGIIYLLDFDTMTFTIRP